MPDLNFISYPSVFCHELSYYLYLLLFPLCTTLYVLTLVSNFLFFSPYNISQTACYSYSLHYLLSRFILYISIACYFRTQVLLFYFQFASNSSLSSFIDIYSYVHYLRYLIRCIKNFLEVFQQLVRLYWHYTICGRKYFQFYSQQFLAKFQVLCHYKAEKEITQGK